MAELMAVITQRQRHRLVVGQGQEAAEMGDPVGVAQRFQSDRGGGAVVAVAQNGLWKISGRNSVVQEQSAVGQARVGAVHQSQTLTSCHEVTS